MKVISYTQLVIKENGKQIQKGMNFGIQKTYSVVLMSTQKNAPYNDHILEEGVIEYEGHDVPSNLNPDKKLVDLSYNTFFTVIFFPFFWFIFNIYNSILTTGRDA